MRVRCLVRMRALHLGSPKTRLAKSVVDFTIVPNCQRFPVRAARRLPPLLLRSLLQWSLLLCRVRLRPLLLLPLRISLWE